MRPLLLLAIVLASSCLTASRALDIATDDYGSHLANGPAPIPPEQCARMVQCARETAFVDADGSAFRVALHPDSDCYAPDAGLGPRLGGSVQYRITSTGRIAERHFMQ